MSVPVQAARLREHGGRGMFGLIVGHSIPSCLHEKQAEHACVRTPFGSVELERFSIHDIQIWVVYRHGPSTTMLAHEINYKANIWALRQMGVSVLLLTSSVGCVSEGIQLNAPLLITDLLMLDNSLPDGSACTYGEGYLICGDALFSPALRNQFKQAWEVHGSSMLPEVTYWYQPGPRTKTPLENKALGALGVDVNSMTIGPEVVLANELGIATIAVGIAHVSPVKTKAAPGFAGDGKVDASFQGVDFSKTVECFVTGCDPCTSCETYVHVRKATGAFSSKTTERQLTIVAAASILFLFLMMLMMYKFMLV